MEIGDIALLVLFEKWSACIPAFFKYFRLRIMFQYFSYFEILLNNKETFSLRTLVLITKGDVVEITTEHIP